MGWRSIIRNALVVFFLFTINCFAAAPTRTYTYTSGETINPDEVSENEDNIFRYLQTGVDTFASGGIASDNITDGTIVNADISGSAAIGYSKLSLGSSLLTGDIKDGEIVNADISSSAAIASSKLNLGGVVLPSGAVFYMITGNCPTGTTDVTTTYSNKMIRINATGGSTGGSDTDSITLTTTELPSHQHGLTGASVANESAHTHQEQVSETSNIYPLHYQATGSAGSQAYFLNAAFSLTGETDQPLHTLGGSAHTHTLSGNADATGSGTAFTVDTVPAYVTCKMCQVD